MADFNNSNLPPVPKKNNAGSKAKFFDFSKEYFKNTVFAFDKIRICVFEGFNKKAQKEVTLFPNSEYAISFKPFLFGQGLILLLIFIIMAGFIISSSKINEALVIRKVIVNQSLAVASSKPIDWTVLIRRSDIKKRSYLVKLPKLSRNIKVKKITGTEAKSVLKTLAIKKTNQPPLKQKKALAVSNESKLFDIVSLLNIIEKYFVSDLDDGVQQVVNSINPDIQTTGDATVVDLSSQATTDSPSASITPATTTVASSNDTTAPTTTPTTPATCATDSDCPSGQTCQSGSCAAPSTTPTTPTTPTTTLATCTSDSDCTSGQVCTNGTCANPATPTTPTTTTITSSNDTTEPTTTPTTPTTCATDSDCPSGQTCQSGSCAAAPTPTPTQTLDTGDFYADISYAQSIAAKVVIGTDPGDYMQSDLDIF
jgi:Cys-rich repeat protein